MHIFISYSRRDRDIMIHVRDVLRQAGLAVWTDEALEPGTSSWVRAIEAALHNAQAMIVILSPEAKDSPWVERETLFAQELNLPIYPLLYRGDNRNALPFHLVSYNYLDVRNDLQPALVRLLAALSVQGQVAPAPRIEVVQPPPAPRPPQLGDRYSDPKTGAIMVYVPPFRDAGCIHGRVPRRRH